MTERKKEFILWAFIEEHDLGDDTYEELNDYRDHVACHDTLEEAVEAFEKLGAKAKAE